MEPRTAPACSQTDSRAQFATLSEDEKQHTYTESGDNSNHRRLQKITKKWKFSFGQKAHYSKDKKVVARAHVLQSPINNSV